MIPVYIADKATGHSLQINNENGISVTLHTHPNLQEEPLSYPFSSWFMNDAGSNDMRVNGATTPQYFSIKGNAATDVFIKTVDLLISDTTLDLSGFGGLSALTNGIKFEYSTPSTGDIIIQQGMKTNISLIRLFSDTPALGEDDAGFRLGQSGGATDTYLMKMDMTKMFGYPWGLRLRKGDISRLSFVVNDNLAGLIAFNVKAYGIQI